MTTPLDPPPEPPLAGDEVATLLGSLERQRRTFAWKCGGLGADDLARTFGSSTMTLGGLLKHVALVEDEVFTVTLLGRPLPDDWGGDRDGDDRPTGWEWDSAAHDAPETLAALWRSAVRRSRAAVAEAAAAGGLDQPADAAFRRGHPSLRRLVVDMIEEYARHAGHADLLREGVDGLTGEDPPDDVPLYPAPTDRSTDRQTDKDTP